MLKKATGSLIALLISVFAIGAVPVFAEEDEHYIQPDDYFVSKDVFKDQDWIYVSLAKMKDAPKKETKGEANFMKIVDGKTIWTKNYWKTRIADKEELKIGTVVIVIDAVGDEDVYRVPESKEEARTNNWFMAKITDVSDLYKNYVTTSGGYKVNIEAIRVIDKETPKK